MRYLITGAIGHLGQHVVTELSKLTEKETIRLGVHVQGGSNRSNG